MFNAAFHHVVDHKLTFDDDACVFVKLSLERCERDKLLPRNDVLLLDRKAEKVNTESAEWVVEMKKQVYTNSWRLDAHDQHLNAIVNGFKEVHSMVMENRKALQKVSRRVGSLQQQVHDGKKLLMQVRNRVGRMSTEMTRFESRLSQSESNIETVASSLQSFRQAYVGRLQQEERNKKIKRVCGIVASVAGFVLAPVLKEVTDAVVDFVNPIDIVEKVFGEHDIAAFLSDKAQDKLPDVIADQLEKYAIPKDEFETLLREEIVLQHPEYVEECMHRGLTLSVDGGQSDVALSVEPTLDAEEAVVLKIVAELHALSLRDVVNTNPKSDSTGQSSRPNVNITPHVNTVTKDFARDCTIEFNKSEPMVTKDPLPSLNDTPTKQTAEKVMTQSSEEEIKTVSVADAIGDVVFIDDLDDFHYHAAVRESQGNLREFTELIELIDANTCDPNAPMTMKLCTVTTSETILCAAEYAYRRGYRSIGDFLVSRMKNSPSFDTTPAHSVELLDDAEEFPFIYAVEESEGDLNECQHLVLSLLSSWTTTKMHWRQRSRPRSSWRRRRQSNGRPLSTLVILDIKILSS